MAFNADKFILQGDTKLHNVAALDGEDQSVPYDEPKSRSVQEVEDFCAKSNLHLKWFTFTANKESSQSMPLCSLFLNSLVSCRIRCGLTRLMVA